MSESIAKSVLKLSNYFINNPGSPTPWEQEWAQIAYLNYYLPLNIRRLEKVILEANRFNLFAQSKKLLDFGAGLGTSVLALEKCIENLNQDSKLGITLTEQSTKAIEIAQSNFPQLKNHTWKTQVEPEYDYNNSIGFFSYSLNELSKTPEWIFKFQSLIIVEPSTHQAGRKLMELRQVLIDKGYHILAPCTHKHACPLLTHSKTDWCHDRIAFNPTPKFLEIEKHLPMKNKTLTMSYLIATKVNLEPRAHCKSANQNSKLERPLVELTKITGAPAQSSAELAHATGELARSTVELARITGDLLKEKGKDRQLICRGPEREFLTWLHKTKIFHELERGDLVKLNSDILKISNELRVNSQDEIQGIL